MTQTAHKKKFKICLVSISLAKGGAERSVAMLSQMLSSLGHQVHIVVLNNEIDFKYSGTLFNLGTLKPKSNTISNQGFSTATCFDLCRGAHSSSCSSTLSVIGAEKINRWK